MLGIGVGVGFGSKVAAVFPSTISNIVAHWRADQGVTVTGAGVSAWVDQSGNNNTLVQGTDGNRPPLVSADTNFQGKPSVNCTGGTKFLTRAVSIAQPYSVFAVVRNTGGSGTWVYDSNASGESGLSQNGAGAGRLYGGSFGADVSPGFLNLTQTAIGVFDSANTNSKLAISANTPQAGANIGTNGITTTLIVGTFQGGSGGGFYIAELAFWSKALSANEIKSLNAYAHDRYGITIGA